MSSPRAVLLLAALAAALAPALPAASSPSKAPAGASRYQTDTSWCKPSPYVADSGQLATSMSRPAGDQATFKVYRNLYMHRSTFYALLPDERAADPSLDDGLTANTAVIRLPVADLPAHLANIKLCHVAGTTALLDVPFSAHRSDAGYLTEQLLPLHSALASGAWRDHAQGSPQHVSRMLMWSVGRTCSDWFKQMMKYVTLPGLAPGTRVCVCGPVCGACLLLPARVLPSGQPSAQQAAPAHTHRAPTAGQQVGSSAAAAAA